MKNQLREWLNEWSTGEGKEEVFRFGERNGQGSVVFCTKAHTYHLSFTGTYLGATATSRRARAGEEWLRGNDLPDGKFSRETFDAITRAIVGYELVVLVPEVKPIAVEQE